MQRHGSQYDLLWYVLEMTLKESMIYYNAPKGTWEKKKKKIKCGEKKTT